MQCRKCCGNGKEWYSEESYGPCSECKGFGFVHCCEGEIEQSNIYEPPLNNGKIIREIYVVEPPPLKTGLEMTWDEVVPDSLVAEITRIILESAKE